MRGKIDALSRSVINGMIENFNKGYEKGGYWSWYWKKVGLRKVKEIGSNQRIGSTRGVRKKTIPDVQLRIGGGGLEAAEPPTPGKA